MGSEDTPCPVGGLFSPVNYTKPDSTNEYTEDVDFTREIQVHFRRAAPRRGKRFGHISKGVPIYCDPAQSGVTRGASIYDRNAMKLGEVPELLLAYENGRQKTCTSELPSAATELCVISEHHQQRENVDLRGSQLNKGPRRRTIYIPSDNNSILTIHPGRPARAALKPSADSEGRKPDFGIQLQSSQLKASHGKSSPAQVRRAALQPTSRSVQEVTPPFDRPGAGSGKENLPPTYARRLEKGKPPSWCTSSSRGRPPTDVRGPSLGARSNSKLTARCDKPHPNPRGPKGLGILPDGFLAHSSEPTIGPSRDSQQPLEGIKQNFKTFHRAYPQTRLSEADRSKPAPSQKCPFPLLTEPLEATGMYEANWLDNQESAITQLANHLFSISDDHEKSEVERLGCAEVRQRLLGFYQHPSTLILYRRLQASLKYGSLKSPESSQQSSRINKDIGFRSEFIRLWTDNYDLPLLKTALEVVTGRQADSDSESKGTDWSELGCRELKPRITKFIDRCLLGPDNGVSRGLSGSAATPNIESWWERLLLRSLMAVYLLDAFAGSYVAANGIFQSSSTINSSHAVLVKLGCLLLPAVGNIARSVAQLGYRVNYDQPPLSSYKYRIVNLATDLRDGVRLAFIAEILLYSSQSIAQHDYVEKQMLRGLEHHALSTSLDRPLSKKLKFPCIGRQQSISNVQVTLDALQGIPCLALVIGKISAQDVVDGHREKSIELLWALIGRWGLGYVIDLKDLRSEIRRAKQSRAVSKVGHNQSVGKPSEIADGLEQHIEALKERSRRIAQLHDLEVQNWTTAFADGILFGKIIDHYQRYISGIEGSLSTKLEKLGCSRCFASVFDSSHGVVFDQTFTISTLAFLCSCLLQQSRKCRGAIILQRAYRCHRNSKMIIGKDLAHQLAKEAWRCRLNRIALSDMRASSMAGVGLVVTSPGREAPLANALEQSIEGFPGVVV